MVGVHDAPAGIATPGMIRFPQIEAEDLKIIDWYSFIRDI